MDLAHREQRIQSICLLVLTAIAIAASLYWLRSILMPFVLALLFSYALTPLVELQIRHLRAPRVVAVTVSIALAFLVLSFVGAVVSSSVAQITANAQDYQAQLQVLTERLVEWLPLERFDIDIDSSIDPLKLLPAETVGSVLVALTNAIVDLLSRGLVVMIFVIFLLLGATTRKPADDGMRSEIENRIERYIVAQSAISGATGLLVGLTLWWLGVDLALVFGLFAFLLNFIPSLGSIVATLLPLPVVLVSPEITPTTAVLAIAIPGAIQLVIGNGISPKVLGDSLDLHPVTVLLALMFWGALWGLVGMVLATPITAVLKILLERFDITAPVAKLLSGTR
jgi:AI-2 transport protein TqsA